MTVTFDPERNEIDALLEFAGSLAGKRVLEIGAGYGRLTWRYAPYVGQLVAIDPDPEQIARARADIPEPLQDRLTLLETTLEDYQPGRPAPRFDLALMSWSL